MPANEVIASTLTLNKKVCKLMGNRFEITVAATTEEEATLHIDAAVNEISRIETLLTTFNEASETALINQQAGISPVKVSLETFELIKRSKRISDLTQGAFDISYGSIDKKLWNFDQQMTSLPDAATAKKMVRLINYRNIILNEKNTTVFLKEKGMRIGFGGIGKGYAAERAKAVLKERGVNSGIVNASGDLTVWGHQPNGQKWTIGIADPERNDLPFSYLEITDTAIATSGNYEKYVLIDGKKYSHTIDPKTGLPVRGIKSATIICANAEIADAMATPVIIMGINVALDMVNQVQGMSCILIDDDNKVYTSKNINLL
jgi:thiamine biosynthesis lipoprotein